MSRFRIFVCLVLLGLLAPLWFVAQAWRERRDWHLLAQSPLVAVHVERALYVRPQGDDFLAHVRVTNRTRRTLLLDLDPAVNPIAPEIAFRGSSIAGRQPIKGWISPSQLRELAQMTQKHYQQKRLIPLLAGKSVDYFVNARDSRKRLSSSMWGAANPHLGVSMGGFLPVKDGRKVEIVSDGTGVETTGGVRYGNGPVSILAPNEWKPLPHPARVLRR